MSATKFKGSGGHKVSNAEALRETAWASVFQRASFSAADVAEAVCGSDCWGRKVIREWAADGRIIELRKEGQTVLWRARDHDPKRRKGAFSRERERPEFAMWRTIRNLRRFKASEVHLLANTEATPLSPEAVQKYCTVLAEAGYLKVTVKANASGRVAAYQVNGRPGPFPPRIVRVPAIYDPNEKTYRILDRRAQA